MQPIKQETISSESSPKIKRLLFSRKAFVIGAIIVIAAGIAAALYFNFSGTSKEQSKKTVITVVRGPAQLSVLATGMIRPIKEVKISPKQTGLLKHLLVKQGDRVKKGQIIARMDDSNLKGQVAAAKAAYLASLDNQKKMKSGNRPQEIARARFQEQKAKQAVSQARKNITRLSAQVEALKAQLSRDKSYAKNQDQLADAGAVSEQSSIDASTAATITRSNLNAALREKEQAIIALAQSQADLKAIQEQTKLMQSGFRVEEIAGATHAAEQQRGQLQHIQSLLNDTVIRAPFDGVITQKYTDAGAIVTPTTSSATTSATSSSIVSLSGQLEMVAQVSESSLPKITIGQKVEITPSAYPERVFEGRVRQIAPAAIVTQNVTTFEVHVDVKDSKNELLSGMNVSAKFIVGEIDDALKIPIACVVSKKSKLGVFVPGEKGEAVFKEIHLGHTMEKEVIVKSGLKEGDKVLTGLSREELTKHGYAKERRRRGFLPGGKKSKKGKRQTEKK